MKTIHSLSEKCQEENVVVLASGDPLFYGVGDLITKKVGKEHVDIIPTCSSAQLAFSRIGQKWDDAHFISLHGRPLKGLVNKIQDEAKVLLLTDEDNNPTAIADYLLSYGEKDWSMTVCENLEGKDEKVQTFKNLNQVRGLFSPSMLSFSSGTPSSSKEKVHSKNEDAFQKECLKRVDH